MTLTTPTMQMDYCTFGDGKQPFVIIPGLSLLPVTPMAQAVKMQYRAFHNDYRVYLFDRKHNITGGYTIEQMAHDTAAAMIQLGLDGACVMGCSQGGMIAQVIAATHPQLVSKLVLCSTAPHPNPTAERVLGRWIELARQGDVKALNRDVFAHVYSKDYYEKYAQSFALAEDLGSPEDLERFVHLATACLDFDLRQLLPRIACPALVVGSHIDNVLTGEGSQEIARALNAQLIMYDNYGHAAYDEAPDLHSHILEFFGTSIQG